MSDVVRRLLAVLPEGRSLPIRQWERRQRAVSVVIAFHAVALGAIAVAVGAPLAHAAGEVTLIGAAALLAAGPWLGRRARTAIAVVGLLSCSALLVHLTGGLVEAHFHFFATIAIITLYQEWFPFGLAIAFVAAHHGLGGLLAPQAVIDHPDAVARPLVWAGIHAGFVAVASVANVVSWRLGEQERLRVERIMDAVGEAIYGRDAQGRITFANPALARLVGTTTADLVGRSAHEALGHSGSSKGCARCAATDPATTPAVVELQLVDGDGALRDVEMVSTSDAAGGRVVSLRDVTVRKAAQDRLVRQALEDELTGLPNRTLLLDRLRHALAVTRRDAGTVAVLLVDLDRFKHVNDTLGRAAGDELLVAAADRLRALTRPGDTVARLAGDEFVLVCAGLADPRDVAVVAERVVAAFVQPFTLSCGSAVVPASVGVTVAGRDADDPETLLRDADVAMVEAKVRGPGRYVLFDERMHARLVRRSRIEQDLHGAVERGELRVVYQPNVDVVSGAITGVEALVRWEHPVLGVVSPVEFIPLAEHSGAIHAIGAWVLEEACRQATAWRGTAIGDALMMAVNLSARQLADPALPETIAAILDRTGHDPRRLCLEITESAVLDLTDGTIARLRALKMLGVRLAVDDFGTGYSSLSYLERLPVDTLKIDRSFLQGVDTSADSRAILSAVTTMAHDLGLTITAEGVERVTQLTAIAGFGCDTAQGYYFSRPERAIDVTVLLAGGVLPAVPVAREVHGRVTVPHEA